MGIFSGSKKIYVASTLYNLAGDEANRPNFLKGIMYSSILANTSSLSESITNTYFQGPGISQRSFFNYAQRNNLAGLPTVTTSNNQAVDSIVVAGEITIPPTPAGLSISIQSSYLTEGDPDIFVEKWVLENYPNRVSEDYLSDYDLNTSTFSVQFPNGDFYSWVDVNFDYQSQYVIAKFFYVLEDNTEALEEGTPISVSVLPDLTDWIQQSSTGTFTPVTLQREMVETREYSDSTPTEVDSAIDADVATNLNTSIDVWEQTTWIGTVGLETEGLFERYTFTGTDSVIGGYSNTVIINEDIGGGVIRTTTQVTTGEQVNESWIQKLDTQTIYENTIVGGEQIFIYEVGTGNVNLDAFSNDLDMTNWQEFFPLLPLRLDNKSIDEAPYDTNGLYEETKKAYKRTTNKSISSILADIADNPDIDDIDYAYIIFGASLNVKENACRKYIFKFFEEMIQFQNTTSSTMTDFATQVAEYEIKLQELIDWENETNIEWESRVDPPVVPTISTPEATVLKLKSDHAELEDHFDIRLQWTHIEKTQVTGVYTFKDILGNTRPANPGETMFENGPDLEWVEREGLQDQNGLYTVRDTLNSIPTIIMYFQVSDTEYSKLTITGLIHHNYVYGGKSVKITSKEALDDSDISGFIIPLHMPTVKAMGLVDATQMATANVHILFNSYEVVKKKWYESFLFKILLVVLIIVVAVIISPATFAAGGGILGSNAIIGASLGLTGTAAIVAGVAANYIASIVVSQILTSVGTELFGEQWGAIFAAIASFAIGAVVSGLDLFSTEGLLGLGNALANGYAGWVKGDIAIKLEELEEAESEYEQQMDYINNLIQGLGGNDLNFNPLSLTSSVYGNVSRRGSRGYMPETADEFIQRTTMTGTDIIKITQSMVYDFVDIQQTLPRN